MTMVIWSCSEPTSFFLVWTNHQHADWIFAVLDHRRDPEANHRQFEGCGGKKCWGFVRDVSRPIRTTQWCTSTAKSRKKTPRWHHSQVSNPGSDWGWNIWEVWRRFLLPLPRWGPNPRPRCLARDKVSKLINHPHGAPSRRWTMAQVGSQIGECHGDLVAPLDLAPPVDGGRWEPRNSLGMVMGIHRDYGQ
jgi:hypothetical protein